MSQKGSAVLFAYLGTYKKSGFNAGEQRQPTAIHELILVQSSFTELPVTNTQHFDVTHTAHKHYLFFSFNN